ncbi:LysM peptidoglycan-binding domain-containing protein [Quadrisphaera sp. GCM10027208]|uniref:LysM peptidoglycan-binding domain-containing protein n=1 Tax=Quadrisphaera sp. GCM10027208 TaxID=3273423 RepID=UPI003608096A
MQSSAARTADPAPIAPAGHGRRRAAAALATLGTTALGATLAAPAAAAGTVVVRAGDTVSHIAVRTGTSVSAIVSANGLDSRATIRVGQRLTVPGPSATRGPAPAAPTALRYTVRAGDTVSHIAARTGTSVSAIVSANGLDSRALIRVGQTLTIPSATSASPSSSSSPAPAGGASGQTTDSGQTTYTVRAGDTVSHIAARTGLPMTEILRLNGLSATSIIRTGQTLRLPGAAAPTPPVAPVVRSTRPYTVRAGDTLSHIAVREGTTVAALREANPGLDGPGTIRVGQQLRLPAGPSPVPNTFAGRTYPGPVAEAAAANREVLATRDVPSRDQMRTIVADTARQWGVDPALALAVAYQESGFNMRAVSPANAVGVMQVIPSSGRWASDLAGRPLDLLDPHDNATAGVVILRSLLRSEPDDLGTAIAGYYQGLAGVRRNGMYPDTRRYVANVQTLMARFR